MESPAEIRERFLRNAESGYKDFSNNVVVPKDHGIIGIRMPLIKQYAKDVCKGDWQRYLNDAAEEYHEDLLLKGFIIAYARTDQEERFRLIKEFVPKMDNWAVCDSFCSAIKVNKKNAASFWDLLLQFIDSDKEFQKRFAVAMMRFHFINTEYAGEVIQHMDTTDDDAYYVKMAVAWCLSECFIKFPEETMRYLRNNKLDDFTFNKALSKITDSYRVSDDIKEEIRAMRRK
jgi:3-methyladenine DNA glycosylase AlkD